MHASPDPSRYTTAARIHHWTTFALITLAYLLINLHDLFARGSDGRANMMGGHYWAGIAVLVLALPRLLNRLRHRPPPIVPAPPAWENLLAGVTHVALYAFLFAQPILGMLTVWTAGRGINLPFLDIGLPSPFERNHDLHEQFEDIHVLLGESFYWVIGLHVVAALCHHLLRRDNTLRRMA